jgi:hypothetical protein
MSATGATGTTAGFGWARTSTGWALNLDGSAASQFALPRLELEQSAAGWLSRCRLGDGTSRESRLHAASIHDAQRTAAEQARGIVGEPYAEMIDRLLG